MDTPDSDMEFNCAGGGPDAFSALSRRGLLTSAAGAAAFAALAPIFLDNQVAHAATYVQYRHPFSNPTVADGWGSRLNNRKTPHRGLDYPQAANTAVPAVADGVVALVALNDCLGNVIVLRHADGFYSGYSHLSSVPTLAKGASVARGATVGRVGDTGDCSQGNHLHLTISPYEDGYSTGDYRTATRDPYAWINERLTASTQPTQPTIQEDDMQMIVIYADATQGAEYGSTAVVTAHRGFVRTSTGTGSRAELTAWTAIAGALGFQITEKHVDTNGYLLAQRL